MFSLSHSRSAQLLQKHKKSYFANFLELLSFLDQSIKQKQSEVKDVKKEKRKKNKHE